MWRLLALSPARVAVAIAWGVAALGSGLGLAALAAWLIARAWQMPPVLDLSVAVVAVRALGISRGLCRYLERLATHDVALRAMTTARTSVYRTLAQSDVWWWRDRSRADLPSGSGRGLRRGDVLVRIGADIDDLGAVVVRVLVPVAVAVVLSLAAVGLIATISPLAAVILAVALGVSGIVAPWMSAVAAREAERAVRVDRAEFTAEGLTVLDHAAELRVAGRLDAALVVADKASQRAVIAEDSAASRSAWAAAATPLSIGVSTFGALLVGIAVYGPTGGLAGGMTPMALTILVLVPLSAFEAVGALPAAATTLTTSRAALHRLRGISAGTRGAVGADSGGSERREWAAVEAAPADVDRGSLGIRECARSEVADEGPVATARRIPMPTGSRVVVVGPSGAGKTTLLMAWAGLFDTPRDGVTFFAEDAHLFGTSLLENLRVARGDLTLDEAESAMRTVGLGPWLDSLPDGLHTSLTAGAAAVSGGQRRRILLARALVAPAHTLLLDEPTEHLSAAEGDRLLRELLDVDSGLVGPERTVVVVTHQLPVGHGADTVVTVDATGACHIEYPHTATSSTT
ncbi:thiol reductant ABC exporter subunit CydC [Nocardia sp. PE-7]|uniref:thiol reductant ABC exporter subunit CydC n=1 Tax=Nocardia sp. PE-7 TaxID=3058426 RepID=UPI0026585779|nr:thiol reductant ABC exporter subunit CydC [Nocardia sp. PE-7]WKG13511.1 thiol reductant ABC exporter subunit CydC [Nocardia sp. PE-7]